MGLVGAVISGFVLAALAPALYGVAGPRTGWLLALFPAALAVFFWRWLGEVNAAPMVVRYDWVPALGLNLSFLVDGLSLLFGLLIAGIGAIIFVYAGGYLGKHPHLGRVYALLLVFMASMLGVVFSGNLLALFVFWELTSISSYLLIGFDHERPQARAAALQALLITGGGGLALLAGILLLGVAAQQSGVSAADSLEMSALLKSADAIRSHSLYLPILLLVACGAFTKSAQFPFHFWLPGAMEAPTPISAYLHSATMVKAGIFLLARLAPVLGGTDAWFYTLAPIGAVTMLVGALRAVPEIDLKRILAYSTVSALGLLVLMLGIGTPQAIAAAVVYTLAHAMYKGALFMVAGILDHETGTRNVRQLGGLWRAMPLTAVAAALAALSMAGVAPMFGFIAKEVFYEATLHGPGEIVITALAFIASALFVVIAVVVGLGPFVGAARDLPKHPHEAPLSLWLGPLLLALLGLALGIMPAMIDERLLARAAAVVLPRGSSESLHLALWHGWSLTLALSMLTLVIGLGLLLVREPLRVWLPVVSHYGPGDLYRLGLRGILSFGEWQTCLLQSGYLRQYLATIFVAASSVAGYALFTRVRLNWSDAWRDVHVHEAALVILIIAATIYAIAAKSRLGAIACLGTVGFGIALLFVCYGAPDVAMTQFLVETLTVILFVLVFYHLPETRQLSRRRDRIRDAGVATSVGAIMSVLVLIAAQVDFFPSISDYYTEHSVSEAHGRNVVNVILVDFRGLDTLGEITVLTVAGIGVFSLLKLRPK